MKILTKIGEVVLFLFFLVLIIFLTNKLSILISLPFFIIIYIFTKKFNIKNYALFIFITAFIIRLFSISILKVSNVDDFLTMFKASKMLINGNLSFIEDGYFINFSYQLGHVLYQGLLLKIINSIHFLQFMNVVITSFICVFIYLITKKLFKEETSRTISLLYVFYLYPIYLNSVLTNQHLPALLFLIVIYIFITKKLNIKYSILIALLLSIANVFRTESIIIILGIIVYNIITITKVNYKKNIINTLVITIIYLLLNTTINGLIYLSPLNTKLENNAPLWKFYCGLSVEHNGYFNEEDQEKFFNNNNPQELLKKRIENDYKEIPVLFLKKEVILWTQTNYDLRIENNINSNFYNFLLKFNQGYLNIVIILLLISLIPFKRIYNDKILFIKILLGIYYCVYLFIEISPRYAYILHILVFLVLGISIELINKRGCYEKDNKIVER